MELLDACRVESDTALLPSLRDITPKGSNHCCPGLCLVLTLCSTMQVSSRMSVGCLLNTVIKYLLWQASRQCVCVSLSLSLSLSLPLYLCLSVFLSLCLCVYDCMRERRRVRER